MPWFRREGARTRAFGRTGSILWLLCLWVESVLGQGTFVFNTGAGQPLVTATRALTPGNGPSVLQVTFGFATEESVTPGTILDSLTVSMQDQQHQSDAIFVTVDASGAVLTPANPGGVPIDPNTITARPIVYPSLQPVLPHQQAYEMTVVLPAVFLGAPVTTVFDFFDNLDGNRSQAWFTDPRVTEVPEPAGVLFLLLASIVMLLGRKIKAGQWSAGLLGLAFGMASVSAQQRTFNLAGRPVQLEDATSDVSVFFASMRFNRAANIWNVEVTLSNHSARVLSAPLVLSIENFSGTSGLLQPDGLDESSKPFVDLTGAVSNGQFAPNQRSTPRTLSLGFDGGAPKLVTRVFVRPSLPGIALATTRTLDQVGQPLPGVTVTESGPSGLRTNLTDPVFGVVTLGHGAGPHSWQFGAPGYLPVWRQQTLSTSAVVVVANPRLVQRETNTVTLTALAGGEITNRSGIRLDIGPGAVAQKTVMSLTARTAQTLPSFLPLGWSPVQAFDLDADGTLLKAATATLELWDALAQSETAALVRWNSAALRWDVVQLIPGNGTRTVSAALPDRGAYAVVVPDGAPLMPPPAQTGQPLAPSSAGLPDLASLRADGSVNPVTSVASRIPDLVTATAMLVVSNAAGALPSGVVLRGEVWEKYQLRNTGPGALPPTGPGTVRHPPQYEAFVVGYQRPGDTNKATLHASFPLRPLLLFGTEELDEATVSVDVLTPTPFAGTVLDTNGGIVTSGSLRVLAGLGDLAGAQAVQLRTLDPANFVDFATNGMSVAAAFELSVSGVAPGRALRIDRGPLASNTFYVLARVRYDQGLYGLEPILRLRSDAQGGVAVAEPATGTAPLPGLRGAGQYLLLAVHQAQGLITGTVRDAKGNPLPGAAVRAAPWLAFTGSSGQYQLLGATGVVNVVVMDLVTGDRGQRTVSLSSSDTGTVADLSTGAAGPQVTTVSPTANATGVSRLAAVSVTFSQPINPAMIVGGGAQLLGTNGQPVDSSLTLNLINTTVTLLPSNPLPADTTFTIQLSPQIQDTTGLPLTGPGTFTFRTAADSSTRNGLAQLTMYEPANGRAPVSGTAGSADPASPVVLVNETTSQTTTILSQADGSFTNSIAADVDDFLSAVLVNQNGSRTSLPASRQIFRDGSVALFNGGGVIEARSTNGTAQVIVEPGAIANKAKLKLDVAAFADVLARMNNTLPPGGKLLGGVNFKIEGDPLRNPAQLRFFVDAAALDLPAGLTPGQASYSVTVPAQVGSTTVYRYVDKMKYRDGYLQTNPGIFDTAEFAIIKARNGNQLPVTGRAISAIVVPGDNGSVVLTDIKPVPGAVVLVNRSDLALVTPSGEVAPGALVAVADENGGFATLATGGSLLPTGNSFSLLAISPLFPGVLGTGAASPQPDVDVASATGNAVFNRNAPPPNSIGPDHVAPLVSATHFPLNPAVGDSTRLVVLANDDQKMSTITVTPQSVDSLDPVQPASSADLTLNLSQQIQQSPQTQRQEYDLKANKPLRANMLMTALDASGNVQSVVYPIEFGGAGAVLVNPRPDPTDTVSPFVVSSSPGAGSENVLPGTPISITFNEPIDPGFTRNVNLAFQLQPAAGTPAVELSADQRTVTLSYYGLASATAYTLLVTSFLQDINGNGLDQNPYNTTPFESFTLSFKTATIAGAPLPGVTSGGGVVAIGRTLFALDRAGPLDGALVVIDASDAGQPRLLKQFDLDSFPRDLIAIPSYAYRRTLSGPIETNDLLVVVGGTVAGEGQWIKVINVSDPANPVRVASALATASSSAGLTKLAWSAPLLGYLESDGDITSVSLVNLQLFIYAQNLSADDFSREPPLGDPGLDLNGDGDYVDTGETLPRLASRLPRNGLINNGLVATYTLRDATSQRIYDFDLGFRGAFLGVVTGPGNQLDAQGQPTGPVLPAQYLTLVNGGQRQDITRTAVPLTDTPKRLLTLFGVTLELGTSSRVANLALVSLPPEGAQTGEIVVIDITNPLSPTPLSEVPIPLRFGVPQSLVRRDDGLLMLATSTDLLLLDPAKLGQAAPANGVDPHPALVGLVAGFGGGARHFAGSAQGLYATALGGDNVLGGLPGAVHITLYTPGTLGIPGRAVPEAGKNNPFNNVVAVNDDDDDGILPPNDTAPAARLPQAHFDNGDDVAGPLDNDLVKLTLRQLPPTSPGGYEGKVVLEVTGAGGITPPVRLFNLAGNPLSGGTSSAGGTLRFETDFASHTGPLSQLSQEDVDLFAEGLRPSGDVVFKLTYFAANGNGVGTDTVHCAVAKLKITEVWSDQFEGHRDNLLPNRAGAYFVDKPNTYLLMGNRADHFSHVGARIQVEPNLDGIKQKIKLALLPIRSEQPSGATSITPLGTSQMFQDASNPDHDQFKIVAPENSVRHFFVGAGFDYTGRPELRTEDVTTVFGGRAYLAGSDLSVSFNDGNHHFLSSDPHLEIVNQSDYDTVYAKWAPIALLSSLAPDLLLDFAPMNLQAYVLGIDMRVPNIAGNGSISVAPDPPGTEFIANSSEHDVGFGYDGAGVPRVPSYTIGTNLSNLQKTIVSNSRFLAELATRITTKAAEVRTAFINTPGQVQFLQFPWNFNGGMDFASGGGVCDVNVDLSSASAFVVSLAQTLATCPEFDLKVALGGCAYNLDVLATVEADPAPFTAASKLKVAALHVKGYLSDRYDWKYEADLDYPLAILQAGYGTLGIGPVNGGRVFEYKVMLDQNVFDLGPFADVFP